jgi:type 1 glutamine amidotransferase
MDTLRIKALLTKDRRLQVDVTEDLEFLADPKLHDYDALVLHFSNWEHPNQPGGAAQENLQEAVAFVYNYGEGRGFHCPLGHNVKAFEAPAVGELFRRGTAWAAGLSPVPK